MRRIINVWIVTGVLAASGCDTAIEDRPRGEGQRAADLGTCEDLGYAGICVGDVSLWYENAACRVRDCASEGKTCGHISASSGYGCLEGPQGSTAFPCSEVGYEGACLSDDLLVWVDNASCRWADCGSDGRSCAWTEAVGYDCVDGGWSDDGPAPDDPLYVVGVRLQPTQAKWVRHIGEEIVPGMRGTRADRIAKAAVVAWWSLKEGVLDLQDPLSYSNCHFPPDQHIGPVDVCPNAGNAWQVGISAVQAAWRSLADVEALAADVHPEKTSTQILVDAASTAGHGPATTTGQTVASSTGRLRLSWLLRDGAVGFEAQYPVVHQECFADAKSWCFGAGWSTSATFAANAWTSKQAIADLETIFDTLAP